MSLNRRDFLRTTGIAGVAVVVSAAGCNNPSQTSDDDPISRLQSMTTDIVPITVDERLARIEKARRLMQDNNIDAMYVESGSGLFYYTGVRWGRSERMLAVVAAPPSPKKSSPACKAGSLPSICAVSITDTGSVTG